MLSDEEKKAIESFKEENNNDLSRFDDFNSYTQFKVKRDKIIIDLIEKQQKEIVHWKAGMKIIEKDKNNHIERLERRIEELDSENEVLEEIKISYEKKTDKLLKEKVKKEKEIEELKRDEETFIHLGEIIGEKKVKDKIKAKIEELEKLDFGTDLVSQFTANLTTITILQSLLEKE